MFRKKLKTNTETLKGLILGRLGVTEGVKCRNVDQSGIVLINSTWLTVVLRPTPGTERFEYSREPRILVTRGSVIIGRYVGKTKNPQGYYYKDPVINQEGRTDANLYEETGPDRIISALYMPSNIGTIDLEPRSTSHLYKTSCQCIL